MQALTFFFAFVAVLALIGVAAWLVRRFAGNRLGANTNRGRMPRLAVIDAAAVDGRRRLVLVRRDNVEHLLMIGGPTDIVVEPNIVRAMPGRDQMAQRAGVGAEPQPRIVPLPDAIGWSDGDGPRSEPRSEPRSDPRSDVFDHAEPQMPEPPPRPVRPTFADELRRPAPLERRERSEPLRNEPLRSDPLAGFAPESIGSPLGGRPEPRPELRGEPMPSRVTSRNEPIMPRPQRPSEAPKVPPVRAPERTAAPPPPPPPSPPPPQPTADQNLAEMAQRLEAALRRPAGDSGEPRVGAPSVAPEPPPSRPAPRPEPSAAPPVAPSPKSGFENLEDEMASLLGRPKPPS
ncbi:flagellar biosynthetic protein FliO [Bradyrhizobium erythrophlei]|uniref:Flagellar biosynthesis protein, FliO n=1 Tax=Bradyrhizobium erythrophlei TaxID=1437360 RepID=A0A1M5UXJ8_9BRAD|nr:flagellar biosynthetic protein FliO [Bradyrhizobium erythrophlei]SHH67568.1 Flagellar biosynthesis protein, FliO [Bradyrhizobium erythrophlei]